MEETALVVSDIHLGAVPESIERAFIGFLRAWPVDAGTLLINGDLFDFWFEYRTVIPARYYQVLRALSDLRDHGVRMMLVGGNHDAWGGEFLERQIGLTLLEGPVELELAGRRALLAHGDGMAQGDLGYKVLRTLLRSGPARRLIRAIHPDLAARIARRVSRTSEELGRGRDRGAERSVVLAEYAERLLQRRQDLDLVIFGHCHIPQLTPVGDGRYYINSGDWVQHRTYTILTPERVEQREWSGREGSGTDRPAG